MAAGGGAGGMLASANGIGAQIELDSDLRPEFLLFHEAPSRILVSTARPGASCRQSRKKSVVAALRIGVTIEGELVIRNRDTLADQTGQSRLCASAGQARSKICSIPDVNIDVR